MCDYNAVFIRGLAAKSLTGLTNSGIHLPRVTIITAAFNVGPYIDAAIGSVCRQTYSDFEYIIVDDGSTDETRAKLNDYVTKDCRIHVVGLAANSGAAVARNVGVSQAKGELVCFLDGDDCWQPTFLEEMIHCFDGQSPDCQGVFCWSEIVDTLGVPQTPCQAPAGRYDLNQFMRAMAPNGNGSSLLLRLDKLIAAGGFRNHPVGHDTEILMELIIKGSSNYLFCLPKALVKYLRRPDSLSQSASNLRIASFDYRLDRFLPYLPISQRLAASYIYLKQAVFLGEPIWASKWARRLLGECSIASMLNIGLHRLAAICFIAAGENRFLADITRQTLGIVRKSTIAPRSLRPGILTFEMQGYTSGKPPGRNPYTSLLGAALTKNGALNVEPGGTPDVWHIHWLHTFLFTRNATSAKYRIRWRSVAKLMTRLVWRKIRGRKNVWTVHNLHSHENPFPRFEKMVVWLCSRSMNHLIVHSIFAKQKVVALYRGIQPEKVHVIPHPHFVGFYPDKISRLEARCKLNLDENSLVFLAFGMIRAYKGVSELMEAFKNFEDPSARLIIVGEMYGGPGMASELIFVAKSDSRIRLVTEFIADIDVQTYFRAADVAVVSYRNILTSGSIPLAQSFGIPCIAPDLPSIREQIGDSGGILYDQWKKDGLLHALEYTRDEKNSLVERGRQHLNAAMKTGWQEAARLTLDIYDMKVNHKGPASNFDRLQKFETKPK